MLKRFFFLLVALLLMLPLSAQKMLKRPLVFVPADSVFVLPKGEHNVIMDIMALDHTLCPQPITIEKADKKAFRKNEQGQNSSRSLAKNFLLTGDAHYFESLEESYFRILPLALYDGILPHSERIAAAQEFLNLTGSIIATDNKRDVYVNLFENCTTRVHTSKFRMLLDMISQYPEGQMVKLRIEGLPSGNTPFVLHIRIPQWAATPKFHINGHEIIRPVVSNGYLVIDRAWHNGEEVFFYLDLP